MSKPQRKFKKGDKIIVANKTLDDWGYLNTKGATGTIVRYSKLSGAYAVKLDNIAITPNIIWKKSTYLTLLNQFTVELL